MSKGTRHLEATETLQQIAEFLPGTPCVLTNFSLLRPAEGDVVRIERTEDRGISISTILRLINATNRQTAKPPNPPNRHQTCGAVCHSGVPQLLLLLDFVRGHVGHWCETSNMSETFSVGQQLTLEGFLAIVFSMFAIYKI